ncbi:MAG: AAA family ATPase [Bdellovibrionales bacterium]|nr:AAA family ATPase [Bdellovibrionales bacterium]
MKQSTGLVLGKFMPPHKGHCYLLDFASENCTDLRIVIDRIPNAPIPEAQREEWLREMYPDAEVTTLQESLPQLPEETKDFWKIWSRTLRALAPEGIDYLFAGESYGARLADAVGATFIPAPGYRSEIPISATEIRADPIANWHYIPEKVRPYFVKRVSIFGPESSGKSTLTEQLAAVFGTVFVPEFARIHLEAAGGRCVQEDMEVIANGQIALEELMVKRANRVLFADTDPLVTPIWSEELFGDCSEAIREMVNSREYDLTLLLAPDLPWIRDTVRYLPNGGQRFFDRCVDALQKAGRRFEVIRGENRLSDAVNAIKREFPSISSREQIVSEEIQQSE